MNGMEGDEVGNYMVKCRWRLGLEMRERKKE